VTSKKFQSKITNDSGMSGKLGIHKTVMLLKYTYKSRLWSRFVWLDIWSTDEIFE